MNISDIIKNNLSFAVNSIGEDCQLVQDSVSYDVSALITNISQDTIQEIQRVEENEINVRFVLPDGAREVQRGDKLIDADGTEWKLHSIISGVYNQVRCVGVLDRTTNLGNKRLRREA